jgi:hypothetical protein
MVPPDISFIHRSRRSGRPKAVNRTSAQSILREENGSQPSSTQERCRRLYRRHSIRLRYGSNLRRHTRCFVKVLLVPSRVGHHGLQLSLGTVLGCVLAGYLGDRISGRNALRPMATLYLLSALGCACSPTRSALLIFRCIGGLGIGGSSVLGPVYISELAPAPLRGRFVGSFQLNICVGILCAYVSNGSWRPGTSEPQSGGGNSVSCSFPLFSSCSCFLAFRRSSLRLVTKSRIEKPRRVLRQLSEPNPEGESNAIIEPVVAHDPERKQSLFVRAYRTPILLGIDRHVQSALWHQRDPLLYE